MIEQAQPTNFKHKSLSESTVVVTGGSRDIGGGIVVELAKAGATICSIFRSHAERAQKVSEQVRQAGGKEPILLQADLTTDEGKTQVFNLWKEKFDNKIDTLVLCASGATMEINVDANMALVDKFLELRKERMQKEKTLPLASIVFLQSEPGHYQRVIDGAFDFIEYYKDKVGPAKRAGEDALLKRLPDMKNAGVRAIVVCPPEVTDTFNMKLFELQNPQAREKSRELSAKLGTQAFVTIAEVASKVHELLENPKVKNGHIELFGDVKDGLTPLSMIYGNEAIYVTTYQKTGENQGIGRLIVNPSVWKRDEEPSFAGEIVEKDEKHLVSKLEITKNHMRGHFRENLSYLLPGHKSVRVAAITLGQLLYPDSDAYLNSYESVKFRSPILPGKTITTKITLISDNQADASIHVNDSDKSVLDIKGLIVKKKNGKEGETTLLLDQLLEAAAQTVGLHVLSEMEDLDGLPMFLGTEKAELLQNIHAADDLLIKIGPVKIVAMQNMQIFTTDVQIYKAVIKTEVEEKQKIPKVVSEELVAKINNLQGIIVSREELFKKLEQAA